MDLDYSQISNIGHTSVENEIIDHSDVSWSIACRRCSNYIFIMDSIHGFNGLGKDNHKTKRETFQLGDSVGLILEIGR